MTEGRQEASTKPVLWPVPLDGGRSTSSGLGTMEDVVEEIPQGTRDCVFHRELKSNN